MFLNSIFAPPDDGRIIGISENGNVCIWKLHTSSDTNEKCLHCDIINAGSKALKNGDKGNGTAGSVGNQGSDTLQLTAAHVIPADDLFCESFQLNVLDLGDGFRSEYGHFILCADSAGCIRLLAELFTPT